MNKFTGQHVLPNCDCPTFPLNVIMIFQDGYDNVNNTFKFVYAIKWYTTRLNNKLFPTSKTKN